MPSRFRRLVLFFFLPLFLYFSMYTWNWKTGHLDRLATLTGLELAGWILTPGRWIQSNAGNFWSRYVYLVGVRQDNEDLNQRISELETELLQVSEKAKTADRLASLLRFSPEPIWDRRGCRVIGQQLGPSAVLETILVDVGLANGIRPNDPVISTKGVVGRIIRPSLHFSSVLLLTDPSSRVPVLSRDGRVPAILQGQGAGALLEAKFISRSDPITVGEILLTSGQGGVFPKGLPVARVVEVVSADASLFQKVYAEPLLALRNYEELLVLSRTDGFDPTQPLNPAQAEPAAGHNATMPGHNATTESRATAHQAGAARNATTPSRRSAETRQPVRERP